MSKYNIILADDHTLFRTGILNILENLPDIEHIYEASNGEEVISIIKQKEGKIDLAILDLKMPKLNGLQVCRKLKKEFPHIKKVILTMIDQEQFINQMLKEDINAYLFKTCTSKYLLNAITEVINKGFYFDNYMIRLMQKSLVTNQKQSEESYYTQRELEVLNVLSQGISASEIAKKLFISKRTVEVHKQNLMDKTGTKTSIELVLYAIKHNLVDLSMFLETDKEDQAGSI